MTILLKLADKYVREGNYAAALDAIVKARQEDPKNPYARAYEERVRALVKSIGPDATSGGTRPPSPVSTTSLEQISNLAIQAEQRRTAGTSSPSQQQVLASQRAEEERKKLEDQRRAALLAKIGTLLARAREFQAKGEFALALDEISRAYLLDPNNKVVHVLEQQIRTAQEEANRRIEFRQAEAAREEQRRREEQLRQAVVRARKEQEEAEQKEEEARSAAQKEKLSQHARRCRELVTAGRIQEAQNELAFIVVLDPLSEEVDRLSREIHEKQEEIRKEELERYRRKEEENRRRQEAIRVAIRKHIDSALKLATKEEFAEGLRTITRAYVIDPFNSDLQACEARIIAEQEQVRKRSEEKRRAAEEAERRKAEEELGKREEAERQKVLMGKTAEVEAKRDANRRTIAQHLAEARGHLAGQRFEAALAELALAVLIDPFDDDVKQLEQEVLAAQSESQAAEVHPGSTGETQEDTVAAEVAAHIADARSLFTKHEFAAALDAVAKAFALNPLDESVQELEEQIQAAERKHLEEVATRKKASEKKTAVGLQILAASEYLQRGSFEDALRAVDEGLLLDPANMELQKLRADISARQASPDRKGPTGETASSGKAEQHLARARENAAKGEYDNALAEIALGLALDPSSQELQKLEREIWSARETGERQAAAAQRVADTGAQEEERKRVLKVHIMAAEEFARLNDVTRALDEIAEAYAIDPSNQSVKDLESKIRAQEEGTQEQSSSPLKLIYRKDKAADGSR